MPTFSATRQNYSTFCAPGKSILLGEHFVVHGCPALAIPLQTVQTTVEITQSGVEHGDESPRPGTLELEFDPAMELSEADRTMARTLAAEAAAAVEAHTGHTPRGRLRTRSTIPIGCGLGSSASFAVALVGALHRAVGHAAPRELLRTQAHRLEQRVHGAPSGIDDAVIASGRSLIRRRDAAGRATMEPIEPAAPLSLVFASVGRPLPTREAVARVRTLCEREPRRFGELLDQARATVERGIAAFAAGDAAALGLELDGCHALLREIGVSTAELDRLVRRARDAGALGAKLTGAGLGGFMLALADAADTGGADAIRAALEEAGGEHCFVCRLEPIDDRGIRGTR